MSIKDSDAVNLFYRNEVSSFLKPQYGEKGFEELRGIFDQWRSWIGEMIDLYDRSTTLPREVEGRIYDFVNTYNSLANELRGYNIDYDEGFAKRGRLVARVGGLMSSIVYGKSFDDNQNSMEFANFLPIYNTIKFDAIKSIGEAEAEYKRLSESLGYSIKDAEDLKKTLQKSAGQITTADYAALFENEAKNHSNISFKKGRGGLGSAELWLITSLAAIGGFLWLLFNIKTAIPVPDKTQGIDLTIFFITRFVVLSFFIYLVTLIIKQYSVHKHLSTLNTHRKNVLKSFELFIKSIDKDDVQTRNALMLEVAKAIYESGQTGYIPTKDGDGSTSMIEMTKFITPNKS